MTAPWEASLPGAHTRKSLWTGGWWARRRLETKLGALLALWFGLQSLPAQWSAFNDHASGPGTHLNTTHYNIVGLEDGTNGFLKDSLSGQALPVTLTISRSGTVLADPSGGGQAPGTPMDTVFASRVDFDSSAFQNNVGFRTGGFVIFTFAGLDPAVPYRFRAGAVRGSATFTSRWTRAELTGVDSFTSSHTPGALTQAEVPGELAPNQVALNFGANHTSATGDLMDWTDIRCGLDGEFSVVCTRYAGTVPNGSSGTATTFGYAPTALLLEGTVEGPVAIVNHPSDQTALEGENATFEVVAGGFPIYYQWFRDGTPIPGAVGPSHTLTGVSLADWQAQFSVMVSNQFNSITSNPARLLIQTRPVPVLSMSGPWRYETLGVDLGTAWKEPDYDDDTWPSGNGPLGYPELFSPSLPIPIETLLLNQPTTTCYFRTEFQYDYPAWKSELFFTNLVDDGAVVYLNGTELYRLGMGEDRFDFGTTATRYTMTARLEKVRVVTKNLVQGTNYLAVEVHHFGSFTPDLVLGLALTARPIPPDHLEFLQLPSGQSLPEGPGPLVLTAEVLAGGPYQVQWFKNGIALPGQTNDTLTVTPAVYDDRGTYWLQVSNLFGRSIQTPACSVVVSPPADWQSFVLPLTNRWRYHAEGQNLGWVWREPAYDDSSWLEGPGALASAGELPPELTGSILPLQTPASVPIMTFYFRTRFPSPSSQGGIFNLVFNNLLDDGAVFYLNGVELRRVRMMPGLITYDVEANNVGDPGQSFEGMLVTDVPFLPENNVLAVEVHQGGAGSSDIVFGTILRVYSETVVEAVRMVQQPQSMVVPLGYPAVFTAEIVGSYPVMYQWHRDGLAVSGATNRNLSLPLTVAGDAGWYVLHTTNAYGFDISEPAFLELSTDNYPWVSLVRGPYLQSCTTTSIVVRWRTDVPCPSEVRHGADPGALDHSALMPIVSVEHEIHLEGLQPGTRYHYQIGSTHSNLAGGEGFEFTTAPGQPKPVRVWVQGDSGTGNSNAQAVANAYFQFTGARQTDVWLMLGDNAYEVGSDANYQSALFDLYPELLRRTPLWLTPGNHDVFATERNGRHAYANIFTLPTQGEAGGAASGTEYYYSFDHGGVHFVSLDSEFSEIAPNAPMLQWLQSDLQASTSDWLIAYWHSPPYSRGSHNSDSEDSLILMRELVLPILEAHGVDVVLSGHSHSYERSYLLDGHYGYSASLRPEMILDAGSGRPGESGAYRKAMPGLAAHQGTVYIVAGSSGQMVPGPLDHPAMAVSLPRLGSVVLDIDGNRLDASFLGDTGQVEDSFTILKDAPPEPLRFVSARLLDGRLVLSWKSVAQERYQVDASPSLAPAEWTPASEWITASGATTFWTNQTALTEPAQFYQARTSAP